MASNRWHKGYNLVCEIGRVSRKINDAIIHCSLNKNSILKHKIPELKIERERLYETLDNHFDEWEEHVLNQLKEGR